MLQDLGPDLFASFPARALAGARVVWVNARWFARQGVDLSRPAMAEKVRRDLLERFALEAVPQNQSGEETSGCVTLSADRYGGSTGSLSGGSGRCAVRDDFNIKGIGRTPLAPVRVDWDHRHGHLWLPEALREAICSEIALAELPWGGVPTIAIIDVGETIEDPEDPKTLFRRRALVVRPNFVRPAHFERSIYFGSAGTRKSEQFLDAERTRGAVKAAGRAAGKGPALFDAIDAMFLRFAGQLGAARANKLWSGRFMSPNVSITGGLADFGIFRAVPNWRGLTGIPGEQLGQDLAHLATAIRSIYYYTRKYARDGSGGLGEDPLIRAVEVEIEAAFMRTLMAGLGVDAPAHAELRRRLAPLLRRFYQLQQRHVMRANSPEAEASPCLHEHLAGKPSGSPELETLAGSMKSAIDEHNAASSAHPVNLSNLQRWLAPRPSLYHVGLTQSVEAVARDVAAADETAEAIATAFIDRMVGLSRRTWPLLPAGFEIHGVGYRAGSAALHVEDLRTGRMGVWIECPVTAGGAPHPFGRPVTIAPPEGRFVVDAHRAMLYAPLDDGEWPGGVTIAGEYFELPALIA
ncbi:MAG: hypothetical protein QM608_22935 [Caulobacter sp.]